MIQLVSCLYSNLADSEFNGRSSRHVHYFLSLKSMLKMKLPFEMYTSLGHKNDFHTEFTPEEMKYINLNYCELSQLDLYEKLKPLKKTNKLEPMRCYEIMYGKTKWLRDVCKTTDAEYVYWIDAGLCHCGIFPNKLKTNPPNNYYDKYFNFKNFNEQLFDRIVRETGDNMYCICHDQSRRVWAQSAPKKYFKHSKIDPIHMIGGLFGGKKDIVIDFCDKFDVLLNRILDDGLLLTEEQIYTIIVCDNPGLYNKQIFDSWYYEESDLYKSWNGERDNIKEFYKLLIP